MGELLQKKEQLFVWKRKHRRDFHSISFNRNYNRRLNTLSMNNKWYLQQEQNENGTLMSNRKHLGSVNAVTM